MKVLLLGGTGAIGTHLSSLIAREGGEVFVTSRTRRFSENNIHYLRGDALEDTFLAEIFNNHWDVIVDFMIYSTVVFKERLHRLLSATSQYVFLSSARVYADSSLPIIESSPRLLDISSDQKYLTTDEYALSKARQENVLFESGRKNWTIIRPYITYSEERLQLGVLEKEEWLYRALCGRTVVFPAGMQSKLTTMTYGSDVARGIYSVLGKEKACGEAFHITNNKACTWNDIINIYQRFFERVTGKKMKINFVNLDVFKNIKQALYQIDYDRMFNRKFDNSKISQFIDIESFVGVEEGLGKCIQDFLRTNKFKEIDWKSEGSKDQILKERTPAFEIKGVKNKFKYYLFRYLPV